MPENELAEALKSNSPIPAKDIPKLFEMLVKCRKESEMTQREIKKYDAMKEVMIKEISGKYAFYESLFAKIFAERSSVIKKDFEIIDKGIKEKDRELLSAGLSGLSELISRSPAMDMEKLRRMLE